MVVITKCKVPQLFITKCDKCYYKVRQVLLKSAIGIILHSAKIITKCDRTTSVGEVHFVLLCNGQLRLRG